MSEKVLDRVIGQVRETALLQTSLAVLEWDERTGLPSSAGAYRAEQITLLSGLIHRRKTDPRLGEWLAELKESELANDPSSPQGATVARLHKDFERNTKLPVDLVKAISKAIVLGQQAWERARKADDWSQFESHMQAIFSLRRQQAERLREPEGTLYDALLDEYEEGARARELTRVFAQLRDDLVALVQELADAGDPPRGESWRPRMSLERQRAISRWIAEQIGYDFRRGRLDETSHPFCATLGPHDCRILTRFQEDFFPSGFYGTLHEAGHGLYEQGLPTEWFGLPPGTYASLGVHESQSRMWENFVGRSQAFWKWCFPHVQSMGDHAWDAMTADEVYRDANRVQPSLIRVEADEVTYNLHILIRFEIEQELIGGSLRVADAPDAWNQRYRDYLDVEPPSARDGILQDVHWSAGLVGYFPTYALGNLYAAQLMKAANQQLGDMDLALASGEFQPLLDWLRKHVHAYGFCMHPKDLIEQASQAPLDAGALTEYLRAKLLPIYGK
ncbi:MAG: carboxypeptidase M32 [bacterium]|nr:carboxypeptidase M32 [bacterium]